MLVERGRELGLVFLKAGKVSAARKVGSYFAKFTIFRNAKMILCRVSLDSGVLVCLSTGMRFTASAVILLMSREKSIHQDTL